MKLYMHQQSSR